MNKNLILLFLLFSQIMTAQKNKMTEQFIQAYYSNFQTGYDFDGEYKSITNNYKATFFGSIFTLTFDALDKNKNIQKRVITFNLKEVESIESYGGDIVEIHDLEGFSIPISNNLLFKTKNEAYQIKVFFSQEDVTTTEIYKAFDDLIKFYKNKK